MASSYKCKNVEKTWQHNATSRHEKCTLEGAIQKFQILKSNLGKLRANKFYLNIFVAYVGILNPMFICLYISWAFCLKKVDSKPKTSFFAPSKLKNVCVDWCWKMKKCSEAFLNLHPMTRKILFPWNPNPLHHFYFGKLLRGWV